MRDQTDSQLVEQLRKRECGEAFEALAERYLPLVQGVCSRVLNNHDEALEASQAVFATLVLKAEGWNKAEELPGWLHQAALAVSVDAAREIEQRRARQIARFGTAEDYPRLRDSDNGLERLDAAVDALPKPLRETVIRHYLLGWPVLRIADADRISPSVLRMILFRAEERLSRSLGLKNTGDLAVLLALARPDGDCDGFSPTDVLQEVRSAPSAGPVTRTVKIARGLLRRWAAWRMAFDSAAAIGIGVVLGAVMALTVPPPVGTNSAAVEVTTSREAVGSPAVPPSWANASMEPMEDHPLILAAKTCRELREFKQVLDATSGPIDEIRDQFERTPLHWASLSGGQEIVLLLMMRGANVNARDIMGKTSLTYAVETEQEMMLLQYLLAGGDPNVVAIDQSTPLAWAALHDNPKLCEILLWRGAEIHPHGVIGQWEPIEAARRGGGEKVRKLFERYAVREIGNEKSLTVGAGSDRVRAIAEVLKSLGGLF